jgi:hypothetical protein
LNQLSNPDYSSLKRQRRIVRDGAAIGKPDNAHKSNANWRLEACTHCPSLALQASISSIKEQQSPDGVARNVGDTVQKLQSALV